MKTIITYFIGLIRPKEKKELTSKLKSAKYIIIIIIEFADCLQNIFYHDRLSKIHKSIE